MLQPIEGDATDKGKHKFMVQSMFATDACDELDKIWASAEPGDLMDSKLKCVFIESSAQNEDNDAEDNSKTEETSSKSPQDATELKLLMEECKRLQLENSKFKQTLDHAQSQSGSQLLMKNV